MWDIIPILFWGWLIYSAIKYGQSDHPSTIGDIDPGDFGSVNH